MVEVLMKQLLNFDPLAYLDISNISEDDKINLRYSLLEKISEYIFLRSLELIPIDKATSFTSQSEVFSYCQKNIPAYDTKINLFLEDFKKDFLAG